MVISAQNMQQFAARGSIALVTGGTGKIGRRLVKALAERGVTVKVLSRTQTHIFDNLKTVSTVTGNINNSPILSETLLDCDYVFHLAVYHNVNDTDISEFRKVNVEGTKALLDAIKGTNVKKVINVSSIVVFEDCGNEERDETWQLKTIHNNDYYSLTKYEALLVARNASSMLPVVTVFPTSVIDGSDFATTYPTGMGTLQKFAWKYIGGGIPGGLLCNIGSGKRIINYVILDDLVDGIIRAATCENNNGHEYILGGVNITVSDYLAACAKRVNKQPPPFRIPFLFLKFLCGFSWILPIPSFIKQIAKGGWGNMCFSSHKAETEIGYQHVSRI